MLIDVNEAMFLVVFVVTLLVVILSVFAAVWLARGIVIELRRSLGQQVDEPTPFDGFNSFVADWISEVQDRRRSSQQARVYLQMMQTFFRKEAIGKLYVDDIVFNQAGVYRYKLPLLKGRNHVGVNHFTDSVMKDLALFLHCEVNLVQQSSFDVRDSRWWVVLCRYGCVDNLNINHKRKNEELTIALDELIERL